jgi:hypothetical protein
MAVLSSSGRPGPAASQKRRRIEETPKVETSVFVIGGRAPFRATVFLPHRETRIATQVLKLAIAEQTDKELPPLPPGHFAVIGEGGGGQVALFRHDKVVGCRDTSSSHHGKLQRPLMRHKDITPQPQQLRVGFEYLYGYSHPYTISDGEIRLEQSLPPASMGKRCENQRTVNMARELVNFVDSNVEICVLGRNSSHFCPFSGGGDVQVFMQTGVSAVVMAGEGSTAGPDPTPADVSPSINITPPKPNEVRCASIENSVSEQQKEEEAQLQLQANMVVTCATLLENRLKCLKNAQELRSIDSIVCYGVLIGSKYPLKLLKLTLDFSGQEMVFEERFHLHQCCFYPVYIDIVLNHLLQNLSASM